jgi:predicted RNase H-like HicB family nuclease
MPHYVAIVEDAGPEKAVGIWFPDLPGCFSAGDDVDEALRNSSEAIELYAEELAKDGRGLPPARSVSELRSDARVAGDLKDHLIALIQAPQTAHAAE